MKKFSDIEYKRPDYAACKKEAKKCIARMKNASCYEDFRNAYVAAEKIYSRIYTMTTVAKIRSNMNTADNFYESECKANSSGNATFSLVLLKLMKVLTGSPYRKQFDEEFGPFMTVNAEYTARLTNLRIVPDMIREDNLGSEYSKIPAGCKTVFRGEECNFYGLLKHMESTDREERKEAFLAWAKLYEGISDRLDENYDKLIKLRVKKAKKLGFANYIEYIYPARGRYDYSPEDAQRFRNQVRDIIVPACQRLYDAQKERLGVDKIRYYDETILFPEGNAMPIGTKDELVAKAGNMYRQLSAETGEYFDFMTEHELFDLETRQNKHLGGYCTFLPDELAPFIFSNFNGTSADVDVLTHEAGHGFEVFEASRNLPLLMQISSTSEINEIHSMSMEHFTYPWMEDFFGENADKYRYSHLCNALTCIPYLVCVDEFQHRVFENPGMSAKERRAAWKKIEETYLPWRDYDGNEFLEEGGFWMQKQHIFLYPFYYIDYALAQICAFQFLLKAEENREEAWNDYLRLCKAGGSMGYFDLLKYANLDNPFDEGTVEKTVAAIEKKIQEFKDKL